MESEKIIKEIKEEFLRNKEKILSLIELEKKNWDFIIDYEKLIGIFDKYEGKNSIINNNFREKNELVSGIGKIAIINLFNPYSVLTMILVSIRTNNNFTFFLKDKLVGINKALIEIAKKVLNSVNYIDFNSYDSFYNIQDNFDCVIYFGNKFEYLDFSKRLTIKSIFENSDEVYVYIDDRSFKNEFLSLDKYAYDNDINVRYYADDFNSSINKINDFGILKKAVIYTKNKDRACEFLQKVKAEKVYVNSNPFENYEFDFDESKVVYSKRMY